MTFNLLTPVWCNINKDNIQIITTFHFWYFDMFLKRIIQLNTYLIFKRLKQKKVFSWLLFTYFSKFIKHYWADMNKTCYISLLLYTRESFIVNPVFENYMKILSKVMSIILLYKCLYNLWNCRWFLLQCLTVQYISNVIPTKFKTWRVLIEVQILGV